MVFQWLSELDLEIREANPSSSPHPALEPVSAWLFREDSPFLATGGQSDGPSSLYSMAIDEGGFDGSVADAFKARSMSSPRGRASLGHLFSRDYLGPLLRLIETNVPDPGVFVLPMPADGVTKDTELRSRQGLGEPPDHPQSDTAAPPPRAIIGIIDHGINIFHRRFRRGDTGSRVAFAWLQGAAQHGSLPFGTEWTRGRIEAAQVAAGDDEDALLRQIGADFERPGFRPLAQRASHGTHVLDLAAGMRPDDPDAASYPIVAVTLPPEVTRETSGSMLALPFVLGLEFILDRARRLMNSEQQVPPVFVNFSFGLTGGPRTGRHPLEQTVHRAAERHMAETGADRPPVVVVAAGNRNMARGHAQSAPGATGLVVAWHIQPADTTSNFLEMRVVAPVLELTDLTLALTPPGQQDALAVSLSIQPDDAGPGPHLLMLDNDAVGRVSVRSMADNLTIITFALAATDPGVTGAAVVPSGDWQVSLDVQGTEPERIDAYILRDDVPHGFRDTGRQSYFVDPDFDDRDETGRLIAEDPGDAQGGVRRSGTLNAIATGPRGCDEDRPLWVVGAYVGPDTSGSLHAAHYSAAPLGDGAERVDCSAQGDYSKVLPGVLAAGTRSGTRVIINGTSVAAPQLVRHLAMGQGDLRPTPEGEATTRLGPSVLFRDA